MATSDDLDAALAHLATFGPDALHAHIVGTRTETLEEHEKTSPLALALVAVTDLQTKLAAERPPKPLSPRLAPFAHELKQLGYGRH